jgi:hypothetical protein
MGRYIARLEIPEQGPVSFERTRGRGHSTLWGEPELMLTYVVSVVQV